MSRLSRQIDLSLRFSSLLTGCIRQKDVNCHRYHLVKNTQVINIERLSPCISWRRCLSASYPCVQQHKPTLPNLEPRGQTTRKTTVKTKLFEKFLNYIQGYEVILQKLLPEVAFKFYKVFSNGTKLLFKDMKEFFWVFHVLSATSNWEKACKSMSRKQLELYLTLPAELLRVAPVLVLSAFPMAQNVVFPLALWAPKRLLSVHFWSAEIKKEVEDENLKSRQAYYRSVFRNLVKIQASPYNYEPSSPRLKSILLNFKHSINKKNSVGQENTIETKSRDSAYDTYKNNMQILATGQHPEVSEILKMVSYFQNCTGPVSLTKLSGVHVRHLLKMHNSKHVGFTSWWNPRTKLQVYANMILEIDKAIQRDNTESLGLKCLVDCCTVRGLNTTNVSEKEAREYLDKWLSISTRLNQDAASLLLHLPIFLGYNHKSRYWDNKTIT